MTKKTAIINPQTHKQRKTRLDNFSFPSLENCHGLTGISVDILKFAKSKNCSAFRGSRVYFLELARWLFLEAADHEDWRGLSDELDAQMKRVRLDKELSKVIEVSEATGCIQAISGICFGALRRMAQEFPKELEMRSKEQIKQRCDTVYDELVKRIQSEVQKLKKASAPE